MALSLEANSLFERAYYMADNKNNDDDANDGFLRLAAYALTKDGVKYEIDSDKDPNKEIKALEDLKKANKPEIEEHLKSLGMTQAQLFISLHIKSLQDSLLHLSGKSSHLIFCKGVSICFI